MTTIYYPFQLTREDVERSSTLEDSDIGRWAIILNGAVQIVSGPEPITLQTHL